MSVILHARTMQMIFCCMALWTVLTTAFQPYQRLLSSSLSSTSSPSPYCQLLHMGMKVNIRIVGRKSSERWLEDACDMYETRLRPSPVEVETTWHKDNAGLTKGVETDQSKGYTVVLLDPLGSVKTSEKFTDDMFEWLDRGGSRLSFVIGGAEGLPSGLKYPASGSNGGGGGSSSGSSSGPKPTMISLSAMTFTHQFARMLLIEQIYRATEIRKGSGYHK